MPISEMLLPEFEHEMAGTRKSLERVPEEMFVTVTVTNALGQVIATPVNNVVIAGPHTTSFDASKLADGTYFYTIHAGSFTQTEKMTVTK